MRKIIKISLWSAVILTLVVFSVFLWFKNCFMYGIDIDSRFSYSPDGKKIFFDALRNFTRNIYSVDIDSFKIKQLTKVGWNYDPVCSPDGSTIAFISDRGKWEEIYIMSTDGSSQKITTGWRDRIPSFSPDSSRIVFSRKMGNPDKSLYGDWVNVQGIYIIDSAGGEARLVTIVPYPPYTGDPQFLDTETITFLHGPDRYIIDISRDKPEVNKRKREEHDPILSSDGKKIAFSKWTKNDEEILRSQEGDQVFVADADGKSLFQLTKNKFDNRVKCFSPDSKKILFLSFRRTSNANYALWEVNIDGSNLRRINFDLRKAK